MPGLNKFIEKTGSRLPTPIIDLITVNEDSIDVTVSLKFNFVNSILDDASIDGFIEEMTDGTSPIYVYVMYVMDTGTISDLVSGKNKDPLSCLYPPVEPLFENVSNAYTQNYVIIELDEFTEVEHVYSEETKNLTVTLSKSAKIDCFFKIVTLGELTLAELLSKTDRNDVTVFSFSSIINFDSDPSQFKYDLIDESVYERRKYNLPDSILEHMTSEVSHEDLYKDSELDVGTKTLFINGENEPYFLSPIYALDNKPYTQDGISSAEIREVFRLLTKNITAESEDLQEILNSIDLITETEDDKFLLQSYEKIRLAFPEKSTVTEMGRTYELFKTRILGVDRRVKSSPLLTEQLYKTPKILDNRPIVIEENNIPEQDPGLTCLFANTTGDPEDEASWTNSIAIYEEVASTDGPGTSDEIKLSSFARTGLCLLDFRLAMQERAVILADFCSNDALELLLGTEALNNYFKLTNVSFNRFSETEINSNTTIKVSYADSAQDYEVSNNKFPLLQAPASTEGNGFNSSTTYFTNNYVQTRGVYNSDLNARILVLQFQDWLDEITDEDDIPTTDFYELKITMEDTTRELQNLIISSFTDYFNDEFDEFYGYASEDCNYDTATGYFNDFFITGITNKYGTDSTKFPWLKMPMMLELYTRFISNNNEEDHIIREKAEQQSALINPFNGTKDNLDLFKERCTKFIADYLIEAPDITPIPHEIETIINPPKPVALLLGEGWDIPEDTENSEDEPMVLTEQWVPFGSQITYEYGRNYNYETYKIGKLYTNESGELFDKLYAEMIKFAATKYPHLEGKASGDDMDGFIYRLFQSYINHYVEDNDTGSGKATKKIFANSMNFATFNFNSDGGTGGGSIENEINCVEGNTACEEAEAAAAAAEAALDKTADTRLIISVERQKPGLVTIDLAFWEVA